MFDCDSLSKQLLRDARFNGILSIDDFLNRWCEESIKHGSYLIRIDDTVYFAIIIFDNTAIVFNPASNLLDIPPELKVLCIFKTVQGRFIQDVSMCWSACVYFLKQYYSITDYYCNNHPMDIYDIILKIFPPVSYEEHRLNINDCLKCSIPSVFGELK